MKFIILALYLSVNFSLSSQTSLITKAEIYGILRFNTEYKYLDELFINFLSGKINLNQLVNNANFKTFTLKNVIKENSIICVDEYKRIQKMNIDDGIKKSLINISKNNKFRYKYLESTSNNRELGIIKLWSYIDYLYPYRCQINNWGEILTESDSILNIDRDKNRYEEALKHIAFSINDGHTQIFKLNENNKKESITVDSLVKKNTILPFVINLENDQVKISKGLYGCNLDGLIIDSINGQIPINFLDTINWNKYRIVNEDIVLIDTNTVTTVKVQGLKSFQVVKFNIFKYSELLSSKRKNCNFKYDYYDVLSKEKPKESILNADTIIIDLRGYPSSYNANKNIQYFFKKAKLGNIRVNKKNIGSFIYDTFEEKGFIKKPNQVIYALINGYTASWSETLCLELMSNKNVIFAGSMSANSLGSTSDKYLFLPYGYRFSTTNIGLLLNGNSVYSYKKNTIMPYISYFNLKKLK